MGDIDLAAERFLSDPEVFADVYNFSVYGGRQVIRPSDLRPLDPRLTYAGPLGKGLAALARTRDVAMSLVSRTDGQRTMAILAVENQSLSCRRMVARMMLYEAMQYEAQFHPRPRSEGSGVRKERREVPPTEETNGDSADGKSAGNPLMEDDGRRIVPVISRVVFFSADRWTAPVSLKELMAGAPQDLLDLVSDYRIHVIQPALMTSEEFGLFQSEFGPVMESIRSANDKTALKTLLRGDKRYWSLGMAAAQVIEACTNVRISGNHMVGGKGANGRVNMCKAVDDMLADERAEGRAEGRVEGRAEGRVEGRAEGRVEGRAEGRVEGQDQERRSTLAALVRQGVLSLQQIADVLRLPLEKVRDMAREVQ